MIKFWFYNSISTAFDVNQFMSSIIQLTIFMLRLNSQYAKSYLRDQPTNSAPQYPEKTNYRSQNRGFSQWQPNPQKDQSDFQRNRYGERRTNPIQAKPNIYSDKEQNFIHNSESIGKGRHIQPQETNLHTFTKSPRMVPERNSSISAKYRALQNRDENQDFGARKTYERFEKYSNPNFESLGEKKDFVAKHNKRNEEVKNRICREESYNSRNYNEYTQNNFARDDFQSKFLQKKGLGSEIYSNKPLRNVENEEFYEEKRQKYNRKLIFDDQCQDIDTRQRIAAREKNSKYSQRFEKQEQLEQKMNNPITDRYPGRNTQLNERKSSSYKDVQQTPSRFNKTSSFQPGSAQKKRSLIEKSQMLQQKLKKLTSTPLHNGQPEKTSQFEPEESKMPSNYRNQSYTSSIPARTPQLRKYSNSNQTQQAIKQPSVRNVETYKPSRNADILRTPSPIVQDRNGGNQGQAIDRIMQLNEKINERIQSIISNYAKK